MLKLGTCALLVLLLLSCDRPKPTTKGAPATPPPATAESPISRVLGQLERLAVGTGKRDCGPDAAQRIREVSELITRDGVGALGRRTFPFCAILHHMSYDPPGMDSVMIHYLSASNDLPTLEFVDATGRVLARTPVKQGSEMIGLELQRVTAFVYVTPSFLAPTTTADPAVLTSGNLEGYPIVRVEGFSKDTKVRLVSDDGTRSEAIPFIHWSEDDPSHEKAAEPLPTPPAE